jgi:hypothetical protein
MTFSKYDQANRAGRHSLPFDNPGTFDCTSKHAPLSFICATLFTVLARYNQSHLTILLPIASLIMLDLRNLQCSSGKTAFASYGKTFVHC